MSPTVPKGCPYVQGQKARRHTCTASASEQQTAKGSPSRILTAGRPIPVKAPATRDTEARASFAAGNITTTAGTATAEAVAVAAASAVAAVNSIAPGTNEGVPQLAMTELNEGAAKRRGNRKRIAAVLEQTTAAAPRDGAREPAREGNPAERSTSLSSPQRLVHVPGTWGEKMFEPSTRVTQLPQTSSRRRNVHR